MAAPAWVALALVAHYVLLWPLLRGGAVEFDAVHMYLPGARRLLDEGWRFFLDARSIQAPPFSFAWPALFGAEAAHVRAANFALSGATLLLLARSAWLVHSRGAAVAAAWLFALSPLLRPYLAAPITEAPFILLGAAWWWGLCEALATRRRWPLVVAVAALALAALTRATLFYWMPLVAAGFGVAWWRARGEARRQARAIALAHLVALLLPLAFVAKNVVLFDFPFYATGGANALYLGNNPLTGGYDPAYVEVGYDVGAIARDQSHLTLEAERLLRGAAKLMLAEQPWQDLARRHARKLAAFVFVTSAEPGARVLRGWRIALVVLGVAGLLLMPRGAPRLLLAGLLAYQALVHVPVLYTHRYSVGALDPWLVVAAGVGTAALARREARAAMALALALLVAGLATSAWLLRTRPLPSPDVLAVPRLQVWQARDVRHVFSPESAVLDLEVGEAPRWRAFNNHVLVLEAALQRAPGQGCGALEVSFRPRGDAVFHAARGRAIADDGAVRRFQVGGAALRFAVPGTLRLAMACAQPHELVVQRLAVYAALGAIDWRERSLGERALFPDLER